MTQTAARPHPEDSYLRYLWMSPDEIRGRAGALRRPFINGHRVLSDSDGDVVLFDGDEDELDERLADILWLASRSTGAAAWVTTWPMRTLIRLTGGAAEELKAAYAKAQQLRELALAEEGRNG